MRFKEIIIIVVIAFLFSCKTESETSDFKKFTGRWSLLMVEIQADSNSTWKRGQDHYKNLNGFIIYDGKGRMGMHHVTENYNQYQFALKGGLDSPTTNDLIHRANNFYFGEYKVNDSLNIIEHQIESVNFENPWENVAKRKYVFSGDTLILNPLTDRYPKIRLKWISLNDKE